MNSEPLYISCFIDVKNDHIFNDQLRLDETVAFNFYK